MIFAIAAGVLLICTAVAWRALPPMESSSRGQAVCVGTIATGVVAAGAAGGAALALDVAAAAMLAAVAAGAVREVLLGKRWPTGAFPVAIAVVAATGCYLRAYQFERVLAADDRRLQPDVRYYQQQAMRTANPFAAGHKSPLWPAMHAPLVRFMADKDAAMRWLSWLAGVAMVPLIAFAIGRLFEPLVGIIVAGTLAVEPWLIDLCTEGLREEFGVCLWLVVLLLLLSGQANWRRAAAAGAAGGLLLLLRNLAVLPLLAMVAMALVQRKWPPRMALLAAVLPIVIVSPFYFNQWRAFGDPMALEKRDARYHANIEFGRRPAPPGLKMPSPVELERNLYAGEPLSPAAYLLRYHTPGELAANQWEGLRRVVAGTPFSQFYSPWMRLACAAGVLASIGIRRQWFAPLFILTSTIGMIAHLMAIGPLELRLLLPVMVIWLTCGWWLIVAAARTAFDARYGRKPRAAR